MTHASNHDAYPLGSIFHVKKSTMDVLFVEFAASLSVQALASLNDQFYVKKIIFNVFLYLYYVLYVSLVHFDVLYFILPMIF
jgi:hypothetical protein